MSHRHLAIAAAAGTALAGLVGISSPAYAVVTCIGQPATIVGSGTITGTAGNDVIVGSTGADTIDAGAGDDLICGVDGPDNITDGPGTDTVLGGAGDDWLQQGASADPNDDLEGGSGSDWVSYGLRTAEVDLELFDYGNGGEGFEGDDLIGIERAETGSGDDQIGGSSADNAIVAGAGNDYVSDSGGNDTIVGGPGDDRLYGYDGDDYIDAGDGANRVFGGDGSDEILGGTGVDEIAGDNGDDVIHGYVGDDVLAGGNDNDAIYDGTGKDAVDLGPGDDVYVAEEAKDNHDTVQGGDGSDTANYADRTANVKLKLNTTTADDGAGAEGDKLLSIENGYGGSGNDTIVGTDGDNDLNGGDGNDVITDLAGADHVQGGSGNDRVTQGADLDAGDYLDGGNDVDLISYVKRLAGSQGVVIDMDATYGNSGELGEDDVLRNFENANGGPAPDTIVGTDDPNIIKAGSGSNGVYGLGGDDAITTGGKDDLVDGGAGVNTISMGGGCDTSLQSEYGQDTVNGGTGSCDKVDYRSRTDNLYIDLGSTYAVNGAFGEDDLLKSVETAYGGDGDDYIQGTGGANLLVGGAGSLAHGSDGADSIYGLGGADTIGTYDTVGGNDSANGGPGSDEVTIDAGDSYASAETLHVF